MALQESDPEHWPTGEQFGDDVAQVFEALITGRAWPKSNQWALERLAEVPMGFRPGYEAGRLRRVHEKAQRAPRAAKRVGVDLVKTATQAGPATLASAWLFGGRSEAQGGGEAPLESGARIER
jgi:hypothetical protein